MRQCESGRKGEGNKEMKIRWQYLLCSTHDSKARGRLQGWRPLDTDPTCGWPPHHRATEGPSPLPWHPSLDCRYGLQLSQPNSSHSPKRESWISYYHLTAQDRMNYGWTHDSSPSLIISALVKVLKSLPSSGSHFPCVPCGHDYPSASQQGQSTHRWKALENGSWGCQRSVRDSWLSAFQDFCFPWAEFSLETFMQGESKKLKPDRQA